MCRGQLGISASLRRFSPSKQFCHSLLHLGCIVCMCVYLRPCVAAEPRQCDWSTQGNEQGIACGSAKPPRCRTQVSKGQKAEACSSKTLPHHDTINSQQPACMPQPIARVHVCAGVHTSALMRSPRCKCQSWARSSWVSTKLKSHTCLTRLQRRLPGYVQTVLCIAMMASDLNARVHLERFFVQS